MPIRASVVLIVTLCLAGPAVALMPPHVTKTVPADGGVLYGNTIEIHGYSLNYAGSKPQVFIDGRDEPLAVTTRLDCRGEGEGARPGSRQVRCVLYVTMAEVVPGLAYRLSFLRTEIGFTGGPPPVPMEPTPRPPDATPPARNPPPG